jgi:hypothetical protein
MSDGLSFGEVLEAADLLTQDEQQELVAILNRRLSLARRQVIAAEIDEARQEFTAGRCVAATPDELLREILQ